MKTGYHFRGRVEGESAGPYRVLQIKDVKPDQPPRYSSLLRTSLAAVPPDSIVRRGDVILVGRGLRNDAIAVEQELPDTVAAAQLFVIRPGPGLSPEYLAWYLNREPAQRYLQGNAAGTNVRIITKEVLGRLPVAVPSLEKQETIVKIHRLSIREAGLLEAIQQKRRRLVEMALLGSLQSETGPLIP